MAMYLNGFASKFLIGASLFSASLAAGATNVSVAPGGNTTLAGSVTLSMTDSRPGGKTYSINCDMSAQAYLNHDNGAITVNSVSFSGGDCDNIASVGGQVVAYDLPWIGTSSGFGSIVISTIAAPHILLKPNGFGPPFAYNCQSNGYTLGNLQWNGGIGGTASTRVYTNVSTKYGTWTSGGCFIQLLLYVAPPQKFSNAP